MNIKEKLKTDCITRIHNCIKICSQIYNMEFPCPFVDFSLTGKCAGLAYHRKNLIKLNLGLLLSEKENFVNRTPGHEAAHLIAHKIFGENIMPHGREWKIIMKAIGQEPSRCHDYESTQPARLHQKFEHFCECSESHLVGRKVHLKINAGAKYRCKNCRQIIT